MDPVRQLPDRRVVYGLVPLAAGLAAIGCTKSMGAIVRVFDTRAAVEEQVGCRA